MLAILTSHPIQYQAPLWRALAEEGSVSFEVWFLTDHAVKPTHDREFGKSFAWDRDLLHGYGYRFLPVRPGWRMDRFRGIEVTESWSKLFKEHGVTRLWVEGWRFSENWAAIFAARRAGIEVWLRGETNDLRPRAGAKEIIRRFLLGRLFGRVNRFLCIGTANRRFYQSFGIEEERLLAAPYCVDNAWFVEQAEEARGQSSEVRQKWGIPDDAFCLLFCGKFISKKRPLDLVAAARQVMAGLPHRKIHLLFVGSGALGAELREGCRVVFDAEGFEDGSRNVDHEPKIPFSSSSTSSLRISNQPSTIVNRQSIPLPPATFAGFLNQGEIVRAYVAADCLVLASDTGETWGLVVNEAMATGLPCIASDQCGSAEDLVRPLSDAAVFPMGDVAALARAIEDQIGHPVAAELVRQQVAMFGIDRTVAAVVARSI
jgi:glycosyltransferase involved in cell wall biosynthesis